MNVINFKTKQKLTRAEQIARLNPEMGKDQIAEQLGIKPEVIILPNERRATVFEWIGFFVVCAGMGALIGWGFTL